MEEATPVIATVADLILPGAGVLATGILTSFGVLHKKWKKPLGQALTAVGAIQAGAYITGEAINEFRVLFPDEWKKLGPLLTSRVEALTKSRPDVDFIMPDDIVIGTSDPSLDPEPLQRAKNSAMFV